MCASFSVIAAHPAQSAQHARPLVAVHGSQLRDAHRQVAVAALLRFVNQDMVRAVHRPQHHLLGLQVHRRKHVVLVMFPVARALVQFHLGQVGRVDVLVSGLALALQNVLFQQPADGRALRQPQRQAGSHRFVHREQFELLAQLAMVAPLRLFQAVEVLLQILLREKRGAVNALQLLVARIALPVRPGRGEQLEGLDLRGVRAHAARGRNR